MDIRQQLLAAFEVEHREHLDAIRSALAGPAEGRAPDWNDVFRRAHSLKGAARAVDLPPVEAVAHRLETLFERVSAGGRGLDREALGATHLALDRIEAFVAQTKDGAAVMPEDALAALDACLGEVRDKPQAEAPPAQPPAPVEPPPHPPAAPSTPSPAEPAAGAVLRVPAGAVESLGHATHGLSALLPGQGGIAEGLTRIAAAAAALVRQAEIGRGRRRGTEAQADPAQMALRNEFGAIEAGLATLARDALDLARVQRSVAAGIEAATARVREEAERLALVPAETAFGGFARALRDLARAENREIEVTMCGLDLPIDRGMLQALKDPVLHALRNALSHGAESPEARRRAGKPAPLHVLFEVAVRGGRLVVAVHDDGRGPDLIAIEARARERGLLEDGEPADPERLLALVFEAGFSTAASLDTLSGRGIGLSVVADAVRRLYGQARLERRQPHGTTLILSLPLSAALRPILLVEAGGGTYALPSEAAERLLRLDPDEFGHMLGRPMTHVGEGSASLTLPVSELARLIGIAPAKRSEGMIPAVLLRAGSGRCVLAVERLHDVRTLLVLPAPPIGADPTLVSGTVILGDGRPVLVLDPEGLIARSGTAAAPAPVDGASPRADSDGTKAARARSTILVVDDSITTRTLEKSILEAAGYRVVVCVDGQDALDRLRAGIEPVDLVLADVEMPRLDGFGLVAALRADESFAQLPVILMTSRGADEDVARGLELGADAYLTKQTFDQGELLGTIGQLL